MAVGEAVGDGDGEALGDAVGRGRRRVVRSTDRSGWGSARCRGVAARASATRPWRPRRRRCDGADGASRAHGDLLCRRYPRAERSAAARPARPARRGPPGSATGRGGRAPAYSRDEHGSADRVLPENQRRTLEELSEDLDLRSGDTRAKQSAFWTMLLLSARHRHRRRLADSTATVIGAMIIAPLSAPIMGVALGIVERRAVPARACVLGERSCRAHRRRSLAFAVPDQRPAVELAGLRSHLPHADRPPRRPRDGRRRAPSRCPGATSRAVLPGVAIAISLVPPLAVVGDLRRSRASERSPSAHSCCSSRTSWR